jgi:hypothetical protein
LLLILPLIILLYLLTRRPQQKILSSLFLWNITIKESQRSILFKKLRRLLNLILVLAAVALLVFALSRPGLRNSTRLNKNKTIIVLDAGGSMRSGSDDSDRYSEAVEEAVRIIQTSGSREFIVIQALREPQLLQPLTSDKAAVIRVLRNSRAFAVEADLEAALLFAVGLHTPDTAIHFISDGAFVSDSFYNFQEYDIQYVNVGEKADNLGITRFVFRRKSNSVSGHQIFLRIGNYSDKQTSVDITIDVAGIRTVEETLAMAENEERSFIFDYTGPSAGIARARIESNDGLEADNTAFFVLSDSGSIKIKLITDSAYFLPKLLERLPNVELTVTDRLNDTSPADIVLYHDVPVPELPAGRYVLINTDSPSLPIERTGILRNPLIIDWETEHPVLESANLANIRIPQAIRFTGSAGLESLVRSSQGTLLYAYDSDKYKAVVFAFDTELSSFSLRVAFPLVITNVLNWLFPGSGMDSIRDIRTGDIARFAVSRSDYPLTIEYPDGEQERRTMAEDTLTIADTGTPGVYSVSGQNRSFQFAANLESSAESDIRPRFTGASGNTAESEQVRDEAGSVRPLWTVFLIFALLILLLEWMLWIRRYAQ